MEFQSTLDQFDYNNSYNNYYSQFDNNNYNNNYYQTPLYDKSYQTTLNQFDTYNYSSGPGLYPSYNNYGQFSTGGNLHDTFKVDRYNNLYGYHTTLDLGNGVQKHLDW